MASVPAVAQDAPATDPISLHLKWKHAFQFAGYYAALEQGYYLDEGLDVTIVEAASDNLAVNALLDGAAQYGIWSADLMQERIAGHPFVVLGVIFQHSPYVIISRRDRAIRKPADLIGRRVMVAARQGEAQFRAMLLREGLTPEDVTVVPHTWRVDDVIAGRVDAEMSYITDQPNQISARGVETALMRPLDYGIDFYGDCLFTTEGEIATHPDRVAAFRRASFKGWEYAMAHVDELVDHILALPGVTDRGLSQQHLRYEAETMRPLIQPKLIEIGHMNPGRWRRIADTYVSLGMISADYSLDGFLYEAHPGEDRRWIFALLGSLAGVVLVSAAAWGWNRQLRRAVSSRTGELLESEKRFAQLAGAAWEAIVIHDEGVVLEANDQYFAMFGYDRAELMGREGIALTTTPESDRLIKAQVGAGRLGPYQAVGRRKSGENFPMELRVRMMDYHGRQVRVAAIRDLTDQKRTEEALHQEKGFVGDVINTLPGVFYVFDRERRLVRWNRRLEEAFGYSPEDLIHRTVEDFIAEADHAKALAAVQGVFRGDEVSMELTARTRNGRPFPIFINGVLSVLDGEPHLVGVAVDLSASKEAEEERGRLSAAIEQAAEAIVITDVEANIQYVNPAFEKISGYTVAEVMGENPRFLKSGIHDDAFFQAMWDTLAKGETWSGRIINKRKDGEFFTQEAVISPVRDAAGETVNYVAVKRDVTEEIKLEEQLRQSQKMEAVGQLAGGIAHDFNNLLQVINCCSELALDALTKGHEAYDRMAEVARAGERAATLVAQLLAFSRRQVLDMRDVDLNTVVTDLMQMIPRVIGGHISVETISGHDLGIVHADPGQLEQILMNLCLNARDAMPDGGTLTIETENVRVGQDFLEAHTGFKPGRYVLLSVTDTGCGMRPEELANVFEPFFTTKDVGEGTGLGLSTVYGLVRQHKGMVNVYSEPGKGSTFKVYLPTAERSAGAVGSKIEGKPVGGSETILLAEDDDLVLRLARTILENAGYTVLAARDGEEALQVFRTYDGTIDLALLDVVMPRLGGKGVFLKIRETHPELPFLFASGYSMNAVHTNFILDEGLRLIQKPYLREDLLRRVREALDATTPA